MEVFKIYIATSWKNQHAVELLTDLLETRFTNVEVKSFVRNANEENLRDGKPEDLSTWIWSEKGQKSFDYDSYWAGHSDLVIAISNLGMDSCVEIGIAYASKVPIFVLHAKGENIGLMRRCFESSFYEYTELIKNIKINFPVVPK
ncbi:MAG: hypothetical protein HOP31_08930 [Ignavibacteria bacterium]|nr:hypothetical protein [Ignavibacteria bacterium]